MEGAELNTDLEKVDSNKLRADVEEQQGEEEADLDLEGPGPTGNLQESQDEGEPKENFLLLLLEVEGNWEYLEGATKEGGGTEGQGQSGLPVRRCGHGDFQVEPEPNPEIEVVEEEQEPACQEPEVLSQWISLDLDLAQLASRIEATSRLGTVTDIMEMVTDKADLSTAPLVVSRENQVERAEMEEVHALPATTARNVRKRKRAVVPAVDIDLETDLQYPPARTLCQADAKTYPKPPVPLPTIIVLALRNSVRGMLSVSDIYKFFMDHFPYFRTAPSGWKNSVRHSLSQAFTKILKPGEREVPGSVNRKGFLWAMRWEKQKQFEKMERVLRTAHAKDPASFDRTLSNPDDFSLLVAGELKRDYSCKRRDKAAATAPPPPPAPPTPLSHGVFKGTASQMLDFLQEQHSKSTVHGVDIVVDGDEGDLVGGNSHVLGPYLHQASPGVYTLSAVPDPNFRREPDLDPQPEAPLVRRRSALGPIGSQSIALNPTIIIPVIL